MHPAQGVMEQMLRGRRACHSAAVPDYATNRRGVVPHVHSGHGATLATCLLTRTRRYTCIATCQCFLAVGMQDFHPFVARSPVRIFPLPAIQNSNFRLSAAALLQAPSMKGSRQGAKAPHFLGPGNATAVNATVMSVMLNSSYNFDFSFFLGFW